MVLGDEVHFNSDTAMGHLPQEECIKYQVSNSVLHCCVKVAFLHGVNWESCPPYAPCLTKKKTPTTFTAHKTQTIGQGLQEHYQICSPLHKSIEGVSINLPTIEISECVNNLLSWLEDWTEEVGQASSVIS